MEVHGKPTDFLRWASSACPGRSRRPGHRARSAPCDSAIRAWPALRSCRMVP